MVEVLHDGQFGNHAIVRAQGIGMQAGGIGIAIGKPGAGFGRAAVQPPGAGEFGAQPGAAVYGIFNKALIELGMDEKEVGVAVGTGNRLVGIPVSIGRIHCPLGAVLLVGFDLVGGVSILGGEHVDTLENVSCRRL